jgi:UDPglucose 6-dehydrogenase
MKETIGFIGQGWIGKNYADDFEARGYTIVRYGLEPEYAGNKEAISECNVVFIAVPTPTTPEGFDSSALRSVLPLVGKGNIAVLKSTMLPGTTEELQNLFPDILVLNSPEFLREANAAYDAAHPGRNIIGIPIEDPLYQEAALKVLSVLPEAPFSKVMSARAAELTKYSGNVFLAMKVVYANMLYDFADALGVEYKSVRDALGADPRIGYSHLQPIDASGHSDKSGRGAGGHCFIKDLEAFRILHDSVRNDLEGSALLAALIKKNNRLLLDSGKDIDLLEATYGPQ